jgi:hypothetical protein
MNKEIIINPRKKRAIIRAPEGCHFTVVDNIRVANRRAYAAAAKLINDSWQIISEDSISRLCKQALKNHRENVIKDVLGEAECMIVKN